MANFKLNKSAIDKITKQAQNKAKGLAIEARELMTKEYLTLVGNFYSEYEPKYYFRHFNNNYSDAGLMASGMGHTFDKYYHNSHNKLYSGGIIISTNNMFNDYNGTQTQVLNSFLNGYHGVPTLGIYGSTEIYNHMEKYRDYLINYYFSGKLKISL